MDILPQSLTEKYHFMPYETAIKKMHFPENKAEFSEARKRFAFEEFLVFTLSLRKLKDREDRMVNSFAMDGRSEIDRFLEALPLQPYGSSEESLERNQV